MAILGCCLIGPSFIENTYDVNRKRYRRTEQFFMQQLDDVDVDDICDFNKTMPSAKESQKQNTYCSQRFPVASFFILVTKIGHQDRAKLRRWISVFFWAIWDRRWIISDLQTIAKQKINIIWHVITITECFSCPGIQARVTLFLLISWRNNSRQSHTSLNLTRMELLAFNFLGFSSRLRF